MALQHLRSSTANKRPTPAAMSDGQLAMNTNLASPGLFLKDSNGDLVKVGPVHVGTTAPNASPAIGGQTGNSLGEQWLDTSSGRYVFKIWDGTAWRTEDGEFVNSSGDTMTGALGIIAGTAAAPGVFFSGDTNTGIYSPGADQVAISTNGTGRLFVDASGNVGVGTTPSYSFHVVETSAVTSAASFSTFYGQGTRADLVLRATSSANDQQRQIIRSNSDSLIFGTENAAVTVFTEKMRLDSSGRLGLGTSSPSNTAGFSQQLEVAGNLPCVSISNTGTGANKYSLGVNSVGAFGVWDNTASAYRMYINSSGSVGIGTTSPSAILQINKGSTAAGIATGTRYTIPFASGADNGQSIDLGLETNSGAKFASIQMVCNNFGVNNGSYLTFRTSADTTGTPSTDLSLERARIDSSGRLLVGTSTGTNNLRLDQKFAVVSTGSAPYGGASFTTYASTGGAAGPRTVIDLQRSRGATDGSFTAVANNDELGSIIWRGADGSQFLDAANISAQVDGTPGANDMPGRLVFSTTADGASSPTERMRIHAGGAVTFAKTNITPANNGFWIEPTGGIFATISSGVNTYHVYSSTSSTYRFYVNEDGGISNFSGNNVNLSDEREKKNISDLDSTWDCLKHWELKKFHYNEDEDAESLRYGVIAQQVAEYCPEVIADWVKQSAEPAKLDDDGNEIEPAKEEIVRMGVKDQQMMWMAIKAIQEAQLRIEALEAEVAALKAP